MKLENSIGNTSLELILVHLALLLGIVFTVMVIASMLRQRRSPQSSVAWLLFIIFFPYIGAPAYLILGRRKIRAVPGMRAAKLATSVKQTVSEEKATYTDLMLRSYGVPGATGGNRVRMLTTGQEGWEGLVEVIGKARSTLHVETFIFSSDETGKEILKLLVKKAESGVKVRLLVDAIGSFHTSDRFFEPLKKAGGKVARFSPIFHNPLKFRMNLRNHRKITVADSRWAMAGGMNIVSDDMSPEARPGQWSDLSFVVEGPEAFNYEQVFRSDWLLSSGEEIVLDPEKSDMAPDDESKSVIQVLPSGPDMVFDTIYDTIMTSTFEARERLWIITPYFVPDEALAKALIIACHRGIDVRIIVPAKSNHPLTDMAGASFLREIDAAGGSILRYAKGMVHAKALLVDRRMAMAGSANMDLRSFFLNCEVMQLCYSLPEILAIEKYAEMLSRDSIKGMPKIGAVRDIAESIVRMGSPLL
ncbi:MAG: cardiolipin synthase [Victivallales bacterium]|jgi:cardiolipin synthase